ncbi:dGTP triphosphohydrolase [uncultured Methanomethylovorans sp.]|uniref:dGTP triphosphohydrolase n=1 Tax=uncultured Methanomethylovorans sp. TaxID=183759 RepID=UPI002AA95045|nr:dNTP triphosphohydrolase [uncultured Methanomethylovorans sp.]
MNHKMQQEFQPSDRLNEDIETTVSLNCSVLDKIKRSEFAKDRDRILYSRAFRRLQHKAQVFSNEKGDHFRTRLTHTLEVSQISRSLARYLFVNEDLVEAIAIGHDIGHTPFGHQGERVLDGVMKGEDDLGMIRYPINYGGFKHNFNGIRVLDVVQTKFEDYNGLNLSWQVLEGVLKHTKIKRCIVCKNCGNCWDIKRFVNDQAIIPRLYLDKRHSVTIEGQIVAIADEIAQRQHDIDDGFRDYSLKLDVDYVYSKIIEISNDIISEYTSSEKTSPEKDKRYEESLTLLNDLKVNLESHEESTKFYKQEILVRDIIEYFILDVLTNSQKNLQQISNLIYDYGREIVDQEFVNFSDVGQKMNISIEKLIKQRILNSWEVNKFDGKAHYITRQHFKAYYRNPLQMPDYVFKRLLSRIKSTSHIYDLELKIGSDETRKLKDINFDSDRSEISTLIETLKIENINKNVVIPEQSGKLFFKSERDRKPSTDDLLKRLKSINSQDVNKLESQEDLFLKCLLENNYIYLSTICDYISGMTDNYAKSQFKELYLVD